LNEKEDGKISHGCESSRSQLQSWLDVYSVILEDRHAERRDRWSDDAEQEEGKNRESNNHKDKKKEWLTNSPTDMTRCKPGRAIWGAAPTISNNRRKQKAFLTNKYLQVMLITLF